MPTLAGQPGPAGRLIRTCSADGLVDRPVQTCCPAGATMQSALAVRPAVMNTSRYTQRGIIHHGTLWYGTYQFHFVSGTIYCLLWWLQRRAAGRATCPLPAPPGRSVRGSVSAVRPGRSQIFPLSVRGTLCMLRRHARSGCANHLRHEVRSDRMVIGCVHTSRSTCL